MMIRVKAFLLFILLNVTTIGQNRFGQFRNFNIGDGLSQTSVGQVFQDKKGFLWFITSDGLNRFDGYKFTVFKYDPSNSNSLSENSIERILLEDSDNNLWIFTGDFAINTFNLRTHIFHHFFSGQTNPGSLAPFKYIHFAMEDSKKNVWISTSAGLSRFDRTNNVFIRYPSISDEPSALMNEPRLKAFEDMDGGLWFFSLHGLYKYNYLTDKIISYKTELQNRSSISSKSVFKMMEDHSKNLWILTDKGLNIYNRKLNNFTRFDFPKPLDVDDASNYHISMEFSNNNFFWIGTKVGLFKFDIGSKIYTPFVSNNSSSTTLTNNCITRIYIDYQNNVWVGTMHGLNKFNPVNATFSRIYTTNMDPSSSIISDIIMDKTGDLWTVNNIQPDFGGTLYKLNAKVEKLEPYPSDGTADGISNIRVFAPFADKTGNLWYGSFGEGVFEYSPVRKNFELYSHKNNDTTSVGGNSVWGFAEDSGGNIWIALFGEGFDKFNSKTKHFQHFTKAMMKSKIPNFTVMSITYGLHDDLWISTMGAGLFHYYIQKNKFEQFIENKWNQNSIASNYILKTRLDHEGHLWIATSNSGIDIFNPDTKHFKHLINNVNDPNSLSSNYVGDIFEDRNKEIWISCSNAIDRYNTVTSKFIHYKSKSTDSTGLLAGKALCIHEDSLGNLWFGTSTIGLSKFDRRSGKFRYWTESDGLPNNVIYGILEDANSKLWLSTNRGLSCFDVMNNKFINYDLSSGLQSNEFTQFSF